MEDFIDDLEYGIDFKIFPEHTSSATTLFPGWRREKLKEGDVIKLVIGLNYHLIGFMKIMNFRLSYMLHYQKMVNIGIMIYLNIYLKTMKIGEYILMM